MNKRKAFFLCLLLVLLTGVLAACGGGGDTPDALTAPTELSYNGSILSWREVEGAEKYSVTIGSGEPFSTGSTGYPFINTSGEAFTVSVTAIAEGKENSPVATHTFIPLASVESFDVTVDGALSWAAVDGATEYQIEVDGGKTETVTEPLYTGLTGGTHSVRVKPVGTSSESGTSYYGAWSTAKSITRLASVGKDTITYSAEGRVLSWSAVAGATKYRLIIKGSLSVDTELTLPRYEMSAADDFTVCIIAMGDNTLLYNSAPAEKTFVCLDAVAGLRVEEGMLQWNPVDGALGYRLRVNGSVQNGVIRECFYRGFPAGEQFTVSVIPVTNDNASFSTWSSSLIFSLLQTPVLKWNNYELDGTANNNLYWDSVLGAAGYELKITHNGTVIATEQLGAGMVSFAYGYGLVGDYTVSVRALAPADGSSRYASNYSTPITVRRLAAPQKSGENYIVSNPTDLSAGFTASFILPSGTNAYRVWRDGGIRENRLLGNFYTDRAVTDGTSVQKIMHTYKIQSVGAAYDPASKTVVLDSLSSQSLTFEITVLPAPTSPSMSGFLYSFSPADGANGYGIRDGYTTVTTLTTTYDLVDIRSGTYTLQACARGDGAAVLASPYSTAITVVRLSAPGNIKISTDASDGILTCSPIEYASSYEAIIDGVSEPLTVSSTTNVKRYISEWGTSLYMRAVANYYEKSVYYMTSPSSATVTFIKLSTPTELRVDGASLVWNAPGNVSDSAYRPTYRLADASGSLYTALPLTVPQFDMAGLFGGQSYTFAVKAIGDGTKYINSESTAVFSARRIDAPEVKREGGSYVISPVKNAASYAVYLGDVLVQTIPETGADFYTFTPQFDAKGDVVVRVIAIAAKSEYFNSLATEIAQKISQLAAPTFDVSLSGGVLSVRVTDPELASLVYVYSINGGNGVDGSDTYTCTVTGSSATVRVYAKGGIFGPDLVYYIDSQSTQKVVAG